MSRKYIRFIIGVLAILMAAGLFFLLLGHSLGWHIRGTGAADLGRVIVAPILALAVGIFVFVRRNYSRQVKAE